MVGTENLSAAHEHFVEIGRTDFEPRRPAVIALAGAPVASISRSSALISGIVSMRLARTAP